jgi:hypothetical protein
MQDLLSKRAVLLAALTEVTELLIYYKVAGLGTEDIARDAARISKRLLKVNQRIEDGLDQNS